MAYDVEARMGWEGFLEKHRPSLFLVVLGVVILGVGVWGMINFSAREPQIEILSEEELNGENRGRIFVDLAGAVQKPGVYQLPAGSRVNDLLIAAGGLSVEADREWVAKNMNLAQKLVDGAKIYIPARGEASGQSSQTLQSGVVGASTGLININTASASQLDALWGIGPVTAQKIINNRPYSSIEELRTKRIVRANVWEAIRDKITVY